MSLLPCPHMLSAEGSNTRSIIYHCAACMLSAVTMAHSGRKKSKIDEITDRFTSVVKDSLSTILNETMESPSTSSSLLTPCGSRSSGQSDITEGMGVASYCQIIYQPSRLFCCIHYHFHCADCRLVGVLYLERRFTGWSINFSHDSISMSELACDTAYRDSEYETGRGGGAMF